MDYTQELEFAKQLAKAAGEIARGYFVETGELVIKAEDNSPVTEADIRINNMVIERIQETYPDIGVLGEEASLNVENKDGLLWVLDPIDGTIPFTLHIPISTFCLALVKDGEPVMGVVYDFMNERMYSAIKGQGARLNGKPIEPVGKPRMKFVEFERWPAAPHDVSDIFAALKREGYQSPNYASFGYMSMMVATGTIAGGVCAGDKPWDVAAAKVILEELGVLVTDLAGQEQRYDGPIRGALVAYPETHAILTGVHANENTGN